MMKDIPTPHKMDGRWNKLASFKLQPGTAGITVANAATGPPVKKYCIKEAVPAAAKQAANGSAPIPNTTWSIGTNTEAEAP